MFLLLMLFILLLIYLKITQNFEHWNKLGVKHLKPLFLFGNILNSTLRRESVYSELIKLYNVFPNDRYIGIYFLTSPILFIRDPELLKLIFVKNFDSFADRRQFVPENVDSIWNKSLFLVKGPKWKETRSILSPAFTSSKMRNIFSLVAETIEYYLIHISKNTSRIELKDISTRFTNDVIALVAFGIKCDSMKYKNNEFYTMTKRLTVLDPLILGFYLLFPSFCKFINLRLSPKRPREFFNDVIMETIKTRTEGETLRKPDMISLLIKEMKRQEKCNQVVSDDEIVARAFSFLFAGFDTVSNALQLCTYQISRNSEIPEKLQCEIDEVLAENDGKLTYDNLIKMRYLDQVVSETFRMWPAAFASDRVCTKMYVIEPKSPEEKRIVLQPGDIVWTSVGGLQNDPKYFENPEAFDPERFCNENKHKINPYTYLPFGIGPRNCIGMRMALLEIKAFLFALLSNYRITPTSSEPTKFVNNAFDLRIEGEIWVDLKKRK